MLVAVVYVNLGVLGGDVRGLDGLGALQGSRVHEFEEVGLLGTHHMPHRPYMLATQT